MGLLDLFCGSSIFSLLLIIIVIGVMYSYYNYKLTQQDYKIRSLFSVVKQLAEEQNAIKVMQFGRNEDPINLEYATQLLPTYDDYGSNNDDTELISVSEDGDEDIQDDDTSIGYEEEVYEDDGDDDIQEDDDSNYVDDNHEEIKTIHLEEPIDLSEPMELNFSSIIETTQETDAINDNHNLEVMVDDIVDPNKINILEDISSETNTNINAITDKVDLKKMSLGKLREIAVEKGLVVDASKLKKNELLKLLGDE